MNKSSKLIIVLALIAAVGFTIDSAFAEDRVVIAENVEYVVVISTIVGSIVSVNEGYLNRPSGEGFSKKKLLSAILGGVTSSLVIIKFDTLGDQVTGMSLLAICITFFIAGYGIDKGWTRLDK